MGWSLVVLDPIKWMMNFDPWIHPLVMIFNEVFKNNMVFDTAGNEFLPVWALLLEIIGLMP